MSKHQVKMAKATENDFNVTLEFLMAAESVMERAKFNSGAPQDQWEDWEQDDADYKEIVKIKNDIAKEERLSVEDVDNRIVMFEFLSSKFAKTSTSWRRLIHGGWTMIENACSPFESHLAWREDINIIHVENEQ